MLSALFLLGPNLPAATYYIDFGAANDSANGTTTSTPWKRAPGMTGFAGSYSHAAGDVFYFKRGVTWASAVYPWTIANSGSAGNIDTYTTTVGWGSGAQPTFDAGATEPAGGMLQATTKSYLTINNLHFTNYATSGVKEDKKAIVFTDCQQITFSNNTFDPYCWINIYAVFITPGTYTNWTIFGNDVSHTSGLLWYASAASGITRTGLTIVGNVAHDFSSQLGGVPGNDVHGDGFVHTYSVPAADATQPVTNYVFASNRAYGDFRRGFGTSGGMTAFFFHEDNITATIYNNVFVPSPVQANMFGAFFVFGTATNGGTSSNITAFNNTLVNPGTSSASAGFHVVDKGTLVFKNNLVTGLNYAVFVEETASTCTFDYNLFDSTNSQLVYGASFQSYATWQAAGRDVHSVLGSTPTFVNSPTDLRLTAASAGRNAGTTGVGIPTTDIDGNVRDSTPDDGAYEYVDPAVPAVPTNYRKPRTLSGGGF